ncbi:metal-sensitive transcriptional regulator [Schaalia odontolytica]|uniref:Copper-sensitive operon repressor n=1 Tax=Schaalia odontolytica TaxID=1660 RepID=A0A2X0UEX6_9ACTO|nr:metal-sensitive transcriptional regulator [Schaalia odontolytica]WMS27059.1 metal-sensitive transcriptional regulator [Schaalia odontolytica]SPT55708.1 Copper-sensitive operon repressor [Schaalia odontolytica]
MATQTQIVNRLKRARGQLDALIEQLESGDGNCREVLTQFAAVNSAMKRASYLAVATIMSQCAQEAVGSRDEAHSRTAHKESFVAGDRVTMEELEQLFLRLT